MENIVAHSLEKLYTKFEEADQLFLDSGMKDMDAYEKGLAEAARRAAAEHMQELYNSMDRMLCDDILRNERYTIQRHDTRKLLHGQHDSDRVYLERMQAAIPSLEIRKKLAIREKLSNI